MRRITLTLACVAILAFCSARFADAGVMANLDFTNSTPTFNGGTTFSNEMNNNNLVIRWGSIANVGGTNVDLVATVTGGTYAANNVAPNAGWATGFDSRVYLNGLSGLTSANYRFGRINLRANHSANFVFALVDPNDNDSQVLADFNFSVLDLDSGLPSISPVTRPTPFGGMESVQLLSQDGTATWTTTANTELSSTYQPTNPAASWAAPVITPTQPFFGATTHGIGADNPTDPLNMTAQQANRTVSFSFQDTSTFALRLGLGPSGEAPFDVFPELDDGGRNFLFTGDVAAVVPEPGSMTVFSLVATCAIFSGWRRRRHGGADRIASPS